MSIKKILRNYILENYLFTDDELALQDNYSFLDKGIIDSTGILEIIYFIEDEFDIRVEDEEMVPENLDTVNNIVAYIEQKLSAK